VQGRDQRVNEGPAERNDPSGEDDNFWVDHVAQSAERAAKHASGTIDHGDRRLVPVRTRASDLLKAALLPVTGQGRIPSGDGWAGRDCLEMPGTAARTRQRVFATAYVHWDVTNLARGAGLAASQLAVEHQRSPDASSDGDDEGGSRAMSGPAADLRKAYGVDVIFHGNGQPGEFLETSAERDASPALDGVDRRSDNAFAGIHDAGGSNADRDRPRIFRPLARRSDQTVNERGGRGDHGFRTLARRAYRLHAHDNLARTIYQGCGQFRAADVKADDRDCHRLGRRRSTATR